MGSMTSTSRHWQLLRSERGAELVEFAFVLPTLLLLIVGVVDFGLLFQKYEVVTNAAREGARVAILPGYNNADVQARVNQYLTAGGLTGTATVSVAAPQATDGRQSMHHGAAGDRELSASVFVHRTDLDGRRSRLAGGQNAQRLVGDAR